MNNAELAETLVANHNLSKADARKVVDDVMAAIVTAAQVRVAVRIAGPRLPIDAEAVILTDPCRAVGRAPAR